MSTSIVPEHNLTGSITRTARESSVIQKYVSDTVQGVGSIGKVHI